MFFKKDRNALSNEADLGRKIQWSQIEDGERLKYLLKEFDDLKKEVNIIINDGYLNRIKELQKSFNDLQIIINQFLQGNFENLDKVYDSKLKELRDLIQAHHEYCEETYVKKTDKVKFSDLDPELIKLIFGSSSDGSKYQFDKEETMREIEWRQYIVTAEPIVVYKGTNKISAKDWYGPNYEQNNFKDAKVEMFYNGNIYNYVTENERKFESNWFDHLVKELNARRPSSIYVPKHGIDKEDEYNPVPVFKYVDYDPDNRTFIFNAGDTVEHVFSIVKYK